MVDEAVSDFGIARSDGSSEVSQLAFDHRADLASHLRRLINAVVAGRIPDEEFASAAELVSKAADALDSVAEEGRRPRPMPDLSSKGADLFPTSPMMGKFNPLSPPIQVEIENGVVRGTATFGYPYEGPPTCVHGGVLALAFDELLGAANFLSGAPGMTGTLTVKYHKPTPLLTPLRLEAKVVRREGRKIFTWGGVYDGDTLTAEAEGLFIQVLADRFIEMVISRDDGGRSLEQLKADAKETGSVGRFRREADSP